ncbi:hypothetical protein [Bergeyella sp. RCAD1439]|uniref:hypothetical protein n=1 Tax=Bergeyella anatis TaxID=3113737 RepID=UPI002E17DCE3|nr:hypothetical protein [Bergeyella sp. RCAD1439]
MIEGWMVFVYEIENDSKNTVFPFAMVLKKMAGVGERWGGARGADLTKKVNKKH